MSFQNCCASLCCQEMVPGQAYTFRFTSGGLGVPPSSDAVRSTLLGDSNFSNPAVSLSQPHIFGPIVVTVSFTYAGQGSLVGQAGQEMQNVINNFWTTGLGSVVFAGSSVGVDVSTPPCDTSYGWVFWVAGGIAVLVLAGILAPDIFALEKLKRAFRS